MKKIIFGFLVGFLAAGAAQPAGAGSHIDISGYYRVMYMNEVNPGHNHRSFTDSYFQDRLNIDLTFRPTEEIAVYWRVRGPGSYQRWGRPNRSRNKGLGEVLYTEHLYGEIRQPWGTVLVGRIDEDLNAYGLASLGYRPENIPVYTKVGPFDGGGPRADGNPFDGLRFSHFWDNGFSLMVQYAKLDNKNQTAGPIEKVRVGAIGWDYVDGRNPFSDQDYDRGQVEAAYAWDGGGLALNAAYDRNATGNAKDQHLRGNPYGWGAANVLNKTEMWSLNPALMHSWGDFSFHFEGLAARGKATYILADDTSRERDGKGYGAYLDFDYSYGPGNVILAGWWVSGTALKDMGNFDEESRSLANLTGSNFYPLLVAYNGLDSTPGGRRSWDYNTSGIGLANDAYEKYVKAAQTIVREGGRELYTSLNGVELNMPGGGWTSSGFEQYVLSTNQYSRAINSSFNNGTDANHWAVALTGNHAFTDDISMHYGLAYLGLNEPNYRVVTSSTYHAYMIDGLNNWYGNSYVEQPKDLGFEIDLGFTFQLLDNLSLTSAFGYMFSGDAYQQLKGYNLIKGPGNSDPTSLQYGDSVKAVWQDADDSYVWFNSLTFCF